MSQSKAFVRFEVGGTAASDPSDVNSARRRSLSKVQHTMHDAGVAVEVQMQVGENGVLGKRPRAAEEFTRGAVFVRAFADVNLPQQTPPADSTR